MLNIIIKGAITFQEMHMITQGCLKICLCLIHVHVLSTIYFSVLNTLGTKINGSQVISVDHPHLL